MQAPSVLVEVSYTSMFATPSWVDVSQYGCSGDTTAGRQHELSQVESTTLRARLFNGLGNLSAWNGNLLPNCPVKVTATWNAVTYPIFSGYLDSATPSEPNAVTSYTELKCSDIFRFLATAPLSSHLYEQTVAALSPQAWYQLGDDVGTIAPADSSGNGYTAKLYGAATWGGRSPVVYDPTTSVDLSNGNATSPTAEGFIQVPPAAIGGTGAWSMEFWFNVVANAGFGPAPNVCRVFLSDNATTIGEVVLFTTPGQEAIKWLSDLNTGPFSVTGSGVVADGNWHHGVITSSARTAGTVKVYLDGVLLASGTAGAGVSTNPLVSGLPGYIGGLASGDASVGVDWSPGFQGQLSHWAFYNFALTGAQVANNHTVGSYLTDVTDTGARLKEILTIVGVPSSLWNIATGLTQVQGETQSLTTTTALQYMHLIEQTEDGLLFVDPSGIVTFYNRGYVMTGTVQATLKDAVPNPGGSPPQVAYEQNPSIVQDDLDLWNIVQVQRQNGILQVAQSAASIAAYGPRLQQGLTGLYQNTDADALYLAQWLLTRFQNPRPRVDSVRLSSTHFGGTALPTMLGLGLWQLVNLQRVTAPGAPSFSDNEVIEAIGHTWEPGKWETTWTLSPFEVVNMNNWFVLGTSALNGSNPLAY